MLLFGKVIDMFKKRFFDVALISHVTDNEFNVMILFDVMIFADEKEHFLIKIYDSINPRPYRMQ